MRALALAQAWKERGCSVGLAYAQMPEHLLTRFTAEQVLLEPIQPADGLDDARATIEAASRLRANWIVADGYQLDAMWQATVMAAGFRLCAYDDYGHLDFYPAQLIVNPNPYADSSLYEGKRDPDGALLLGAEYVALRREFLRWRHPRERAPGNRVLVTMGGIDTGGWGPTVAAILASTGHWAVTIVVGAESPARRAAEKVEELPGVDLVVDPPDMAALMATSDLAVGAGGTTAWELAFMGIPMVLFELAENQHLVVQAAARFGVGFGLGPPTTEQLARVPELLERLRRDPGLYRSMSASGRRLVDGLGAKRLLDALTTWDVRGP